MAKYHARKGVCYMSASGTTVAVKVPNLTKFGIQFGRDRVETTCLGDTNKSYVQGLEDIQGSFSGYFDDAQTAALFTSAASADGVLMYLYPSADAPGRYFYGPAWVDISSFDVEVSGAVSFSGNFAANGAWGKILS